MANALVIGHKYGHLTVLKEAPRDKNGKPRVICKCDCGFIGSFTEYPILKGMYNIDARYLFGEYVGELNDVPDPPREIIDSVIKKCKKYKENKEASAIPAGAFPKEAAI